MVTKKLEELTRRVADLEGQRERDAVERKELVRRLDRMAGEVRDAKQLQQRVEALEGAVSRMQSDAEVAFCGEETQQDLFELCKDMA